MDSTMVQAEGRQDFPLAETNSILIAEAAIEALINNAAPEFAWHELKHHKLPFVSKTVQQLGERVLEIQNLNKDALNMACNDESEREPTPGPKDKVVPN